MILAAALLYYASAVVDRVGARAGAVVLMCGVNLHRLPASRSPDSRSHKRHGLCQAYRLRTTWPLQSALAGAAYRAWPFGLAASALRGSIP